VKALAGGGLVLAVVATVLASLGMGYLLYILSLAGVYAIVGLGLTVLTGYTHQISLGHAGFLAIGAYTYVYLAAHTSLPVPLNLLIGGLAAATVGYGVGVPAVRMRGPYLAMATLTFGLAVQRLASNWPAVTGGPVGLRVPRPRLLGLSLSSDVATYALVWGLLLGLAWLTMNLHDSASGRAMRALRDSETGALVFGVDLARAKSLAFAVSAFDTGIAGGLYALLVGYINVESFSLWLSISFFALPIIGGLGSVGGAVVGGLFMALVPYLLSGVPNLPGAVFGLSLILVMFFLPRGIWSLRAVVRRSWDVGRLTRE
jgi:branched-chain amino acid transport system permease protein